MDLRAAAADQADLVGAKAAALARLLRAGFPVPFGFVVTAAASLDEQGRSDVLRALAALTEGPVAVRSSSPAEDTTTASYAGQYETVLSVRGDDAVIDAIARVRASASSAGPRH